MLPIKIRVIVGLACAFLAIGFLVLCGFGYGWVLVFPISILAMICSHEIMSVIKCENELLIWISTISSGILPVYIIFDLKQYLPFNQSVLGISYVISVLILMIRMYDKTKFEDVAVGVFVSFGVSYSLTTTWMTYDLLESHHELFTRSNTIFIILSAMYAAWFTDACALFAGKAFGKHKMAPRISPKKTVEGAVGGVLGTLVLSLITFFICEKFFFKTDTLKWWMVLIIIPLASILGMFGDLTASVIKRNFGVKDFGKILPGHGGIMDRVDSFLFVMPSYYAMLKIAIALVK